MSRESVGPLLHAFNDLGQQIGHLLYLTFGWDVRGRCLGGVNLGRLPMDPVGVSQQAVLGHDRCFELVCR